MVQPAQLRDIRLFSNLSDDDLNRIAARLTDCNFLSGSVILSRQVPPDALYIILSGAVRVELRGESGEIFNLTELGSGEIFGERALLTGEARTADVRALSAVQAARLSRADFEAIFTTIPQFNANLCRDLARQLGTWAQRHQREGKETREMLTDVIGWQLLPEFNAFPGRSPWVRDLNARLASLGGSRDHVLILGERGTWKDLAARLIHFHADEDRPILFLDCAAPPPVIPENGDVSRHHDPLHLELSQEAVLFGHTPDSTLYPRRTRRGLLELADGGELILRNIDALTPRLQERLLDFLRDGRYCRCGEKEPRRAQVRMIATSGEPLPKMAETGDFSPELFRRISANEIEMLPLRERKKDIPIIARSLLRSLNAKHHKQVRHLSQDALNRLVEHNWPLNGSELYQVLSRAVVVCTDDVIHAEQIFLQGQPFEDGRFNLMSLPAVERLARRPDFPRIFRHVTVPLFLLLTLYLLFGPPRDNAANLAVWTIWWPLLLVTAFFGARSWCSFCPLEALGEAAGKGRRAGVEPAGWLRRWGPALSMAGLAAIVLIEHASGMFSRAHATGLLLTALLLATMTGDYFLGKRGWCKYLCPLGRLVSLVTRVSLLEMRSSQTVCASRCRVDDCIKEKGCPMGLHPTGIDNSDHCILCLDCVRSCPHHSMQLNLRNPAAGLFHRSRRGFAEALFSVALVGVVLAAKGTLLLFGREAEIFPGSRWRAEEFWVALCLIITFVLLASGASFASRSSRWQATFTLCGLAYLPLALCGLFVIYLRALAEGGAMIVPQVITALGLADWFDPAVVTPELGTLRLLIAPLLIGGAAISWYVLGRLRQLYTLSQFRIAGHRGLVLATALLFLYLL